MVYSKMPQQRAQDAGKKLNSEMSFFTARSQTVRKIIVQTVILKKSMGKIRKKSKIFFQIK